MRGKVYSEEDFLPLSALQHFIFCERQCALIHIELVWEENYYTAQGRNLHERVDQGGERLGKEVKIEYSVPLRSFELGLVGKADVVEYHLREDAGKKLWVPYPVEYKRGRPKKDDSDKVQLCAQALCLEEMTGLKIKEGALFYGKTRRRFQIDFDMVLRETTKKVSEKLHLFIEAGKTPPPRYAKKCDRCSLIDVCMPKKMGNKGTVNNYLQGVFAHEKIA